MKSVIQSSAVNANEALQHEITLAPTNRHIEEESCEKKTRSRKEKENHKKKVLKGAK